MSAITYNKAITIRMNMLSESKKAKSICAKRPQSQECRVAWDQVEELCASLNDCQVKHSIEIKEEMWVEESKFYDV
jgi:hypothetical protein